MQDAFLRVCFHQVLDAVRRLNNSSRAQLDPLFRLLWGLRVWKGLGLIV